MKTLNKKSEPRLKGNSVTNDDSTTSVIKEYLLLVKRRDGCPPWEISAKKIEHKKKKKKLLITGMQFLKIYDFPVAYFPNFIILIRLLKDNLDF